MTRSLGREERGSGPGVRTTARVLPARRGCDGGAGGASQPPARRHRPTGPARLPGLSPRPWPELHGPIRSVPSRSPGVAMSQRPGGSTLAPPPAAAQAPSTAALKSGQGRPHLPRTAVGTAGGWGRGGVGARRRVGKGPLCPAEGGRADRDTAAWGQPEWQQGGPGAWPTSQDPQPTRSQPSSRLKTPVPPGSVWPPDRGVP